MEQVWDHDVEYTISLVQDILSKKIDFKMNDVQYLAAGFDNCAFIINKEFIFRFACREKGLEFLKNEMKALPILDGQLPLKTPRILYSGLYQEKWPWIGYQKINGRPIYETNFDRAKCVKPIASFLNQLHTLPIKPFQNAGLLGDWFGHLNLEKRIPYTKQKLKTLLDSHVLEYDNAFDHVIDSVSGFEVSPAQVIVHGDFKATHILLKDNLPCGVIDWGDVHLGHPAVDLAIAYSFFSPKDRNQFIHDYGTNDKQIWQLARFRAFFHTLAIIEYSYKTHQKTILDEAQQALKWIISDE